MPSFRAAALVGAPCSSVLRTSDSVDRPEGWLEVPGWARGAHSHGLLDDALSCCGEEEAFRAGPPCSSLRRTSDAEARSADWPERHNWALPDRVVPALRSGAMLRRFNVGGVVLA